MRTVHRRYLRELLLSVSIYVLLLFTCFHFVARVHNPFGRGALALLPMLPQLWTIRAIVRLLRDQDELERRIALEGVAIAACLVGFGYFSYGLMLSAHAAPEWSSAMLAMWVMPLLSIVCGITQGILIWRLRR